MLLSQEEIFALAKNGNVRFDILWSRLHGGGDWVIYAAQGVADFDRLIGIMVMGTEASARFFVEDIQIGDRVLGQRPFNVEDVVALRNKFIEFYGTVNEINEYGPKPSKAFETVVITQP